MKAISLNEAYNELNRVIQEVSGKLSAADRNKLAHLILTLDTAITANQQSLDKDNINICLESLHRLIPNLQWHRCKDEHLLAFLDFFTQEQISIILGVNIRTVYAAKDNIRRRRGSTKLSDGELPTDIESIRKMSDEEFLDFAALQTRVSALKSLSSSNTDITKWMLTNRQDQKFKELENMWQLCKDWLAWWTGEYIPKLMKRIAQSKPPFDVKVLAAEVADEKYNELVRKYQEVKPKEETPWEVVEKKAKRRGKLKPTRKIEEKEAKLLKASGSTAQVQIENAGSISESANQGVAD